MQLTFPAAAPLHSLSWPLPGPAPNSIQIPGPWETRPPPHEHTYCLSPGKPKGHPHMLYRQAFSSLSSAPGPSHRLTTLSEGGGLSSADVQSRWGRLHLGLGANSCKP